MRYSGELAVRLPPKPDSPEEREAWLKKATRRLVLLLEHYSIDWPEDGNPDWRMLSVKLASAHVPGLQPAKKRGRKNRNNTGEAMQARAKLLSAVEQAAKGKSGHTSADTQILKKLSKKEIPEFFSGKKFHTLRGQLGLARKERSEKARWTNELANMLAQHRPAVGLSELGRHAMSESASKGATSSKPRKSDPK